MRSGGEVLENLALPVYVPVTLRHGRRDQARGNLIGQMVVPLPIGTSDPAGRLRQIAAETAERKARSRPSLGSLLRSGIARWALLKVLDRQPVNVTTADLPGPPRAALSRRCSATRGISSLASHSQGVVGFRRAVLRRPFNIMAVADHLACPDVHVFAASAREELQALAATTLSRSGAVLRLSATGSALVWPDYDHLVRTPGGC